MGTASGVLRAPEERRRRWHSPCRTPAWASAAAELSGSAATAVVAAPTAQASSKAVAAPHGAAPLAAALRPTRQRMRGAGAAYFERYLRNRRRRGGEFLGEEGALGAPPPPPGAWAPRLSSDPLYPGVPPLSFGNVAGGVVAAPSRWPQHAAIVRATVHAAIAAYRLAPPPEPRRPGGTPERPRDAVPRERVAELLARLRPSDGLVIAPPGGGAAAPAAAAAASIPLPPLPAVDAARAAGEAVQVHMFWDVWSLHPRALDPRTVAARLRRTLGAAGTLVGLYAYATRRQLAWVPEALVRLYAPDRLAGAQQAMVREQLAQARRGGAAKQAQEAPVVDSAVAAAAAGPGSAALEAGTRLRCPVCGRSTRSYAQLQRHMADVHKTRAPPPEEVQVLPSRAAEQQQRQRPAEQRARHQRDLPTGAASALAAEAAAAAWDGSLFNSGSRTLGKVAAYAASGGELFVPPPGRQISLRYVLAREGADVRVVQNERAAVDASLADGLAALLDSVERGGGGGHVVVAVASDSRAHAPLLDRARRLGCSTVAVCDQRGSYPEADALLRWRLVTAGRYAVQS